MASMDFLWYTFDVAGMIKSAERKVKRCKRLHRVPVVAQTYTYCIKLNFSCHLNHKEEANDDILSYDPEHVKRVGFA